jgi:hypothetical protein
MGFERRLVFFVVDENCSKRESTFHPRKGNSFHPWNREKLSVHGQNFKKSTIQPF